MQLAGIGRRLGRAGNLRLGDAFHQWRTGTVQIDAGGAIEHVVQRLAGVFFQMRAGDADALAVALAHGDVQMPIGHDRQFELADLVALGQIGIEIMLAREHRSRRDIGIDGQAEQGRHANHLFVDHRQHARHGHIDRIGLGVRLGPVGRRRGRENLALCRELDMHFQPDHGFPVHGVFLGWASFIRSPADGGYASPWLADSYGRR